MALTLSRSEMEMLETLIDRCRLDEVLRSIGIICTDKADHLVMEWQDRRTARIWENAAKAVFNASENAAVQAVSA